MIADDHCLKAHFAERGGKGWMYTLTEVVPMLREAGVTEGRLNGILVENPKRIFAVRGGEVMKIGSVMPDVDAMGVTETNDRGTYVVLSNPEGNRLQIHFAG